MHEYNSGTMIPGSFGHTPRPVPLPSATRADGTWTMRSRRSWNVDIVGMSDLCHDRGTIYVGNHDGLQWNKHGLILLRTESTISLWETRPQRPRYGVPTS